MASGLPASVPAWNTGAERRQRLHHVAPTADGADRQPAADHLAERREVGRHVVLGLGAAGSTRNPVITSSKIEQGADAVALGAQPVEEPGSRRDDAHVGGDRLDDHGGHDVVELGHLVVRHDERLGDGAGRHPGGAGSPSVATPLPPAASRASVAPWKLPWNDTMRSRPVNPRASRTAVLVASVPEFISRTCSQLATRAEIVLGELHLPRRRRAVRRAVGGGGLRIAAVIAGWAWPRITAP